MECEEVRVALSARLDGEDPRLPAATIEAHTSTCAGCRQWLAGAERVTQAMRKAAAVEAPDLTVRVLTAVAADERDRAAARSAAVAGRRQVLRVAVALLAIAQLAAAAPIMFGGADVHTSREMASFDVALAVGFALAAWRPERAQALVPVAFVLALCLAVTSTVDVVNSHTAIVHEIGHLAAVVQAAALWALGRVDRGGDRPLSTATAAGRG